MWSPANTQRRRLEGTQDGEELLKGNIYTWALSVLFNRLSALSSKSLAVKVPMLKALPIKVHPKEMYFRTVFEDFPFA